MSNWINLKYYSRIVKIKKISDQLSNNKSDLIEDKIKTKTKKLTKYQEQLIIRSNATEYVNHIIKKSSSSHNIQKHLHNLVFDPRNRTRSTTRVK